MFAVKKGVSTFCFSNCHVNNNKGAPNYKANTASIATLYVELVHPPLQQNSTYSNIPRSLQQMQQYSRSHRFLQFCSEYLGNVSPSLSIQMKLFAMTKPNGASIRRATAHLVKCSLNMLNAAEYASASPITARPKLWSAFSRVSENCFAVSRASRVGKALI